MALCVGQEDLVIITVSRGKQMFTAKSFPGRNAKLRMGGGQHSVEEGCAGTRTLEQTPREGQGPS